MTTERLIHPFGPFYRPDSRILILGSFPSVKSREQRFFYGHPQNRFWRVLAALYNEPVPAAISEKEALLERRRIALWDVFGACTITGSADSTIRDASPNDLTRILDAAPIERIFVNGKTAGAYYLRHIRPQLLREATVLPSTSPANAACSFERLLAAWRAILS